MSAHQQELQGGLEKQRSNDTALLAVERRGRAQEQRQVEAMSKQLQDKVAQVAKEDQQVRSLSQQRVALLRQSQALKAGGQQLIRKFDELRSQSDATRMQLSEKVQCGSPWEP